MNIILDTHMLICALKGDGKLSEKAKSLILDPNNEIYCSVISLWEIEIKRLKAGLPFTAREIADYCREAGFQILPLGEGCIFELEGLKRPAGCRSHNDPFDKMLVCQAVGEGCSLLTHDSLIKDCECKNIIYV